MKKVTLMELENKIKEIEGKIPGIKKYLSGSSFSSRDNIYPSTQLTDSQSMQDVAYLETENYHLVAVLMNGSLTRTDLKTGRVRSTRDYMRYIEAYIKFKVKPLDRTKGKKIHSRYVHQSLDLLMEPELAKYNAVAVERIDDDQVRVFATDKDGNRALEYEVSLDPECNYLI